MFFLPSVPLRRTSIFLAAAALTFPVSLARVNGVAPGLESALEDTLQEPPDQTTERLASLGELWGTIKYLHPYLAYLDIDWDAALVEAVPAVMAATTPEAYATAVQGMLDALGDPATKVTDSSDPETLPGSEATHPLVTTTDQNVLIIEMSDYGDLGNWIAATPRLREGLAGLGEAQAVVVDVRLLHGTSMGIGPGMMLQLSGVNDVLVGSAAAGPGQRFRMHEGLPGVGRFGRGIYSSSFQVQDGMTFGPGSLNEGTPVVFLANRAGEVPPLALALQASGQGAIVSEGPLSDEDLVARATMELADSVFVQYRTGEILYADGTSGITADTVLEPNPGAPEAALARAVEYALFFDGSTRRGSQVPVVAAPTADDLYPEMLYPDLGYRMLTAFRIWAGIEFFFAYPHLMEHDWSEVLREFLPRFQAAADSQAYALTVSEMVTRIQDSHGFVSGPVHRQYIGSSYPPFLVRMIEGVPLVTALTDEAAATEAGVGVGDEILAVDGESASHRIERLARYYAASNEDALLRNVTGSLVTGAEGIDAVVTVRKPDGSEVELSVPRRASFIGRGNYRTTEVVQMLEGGVGYVDLDRLTQPEIPGMMEQLGEARAIIFDMRGYPDDNVFMLGAWLGLDDDTPIADFRQPILTAADGEWGKTSRSFKQVLPLPAYPTTFDGPTVMLVDERTQSSAEHTGLLFEAANGTRFVGSNSAGANGNVTTLGVPGGITVTFTGLDTRHGDGRQLQRIGIEPHLYVKPTIAGIRAGRDEVLEAGVEYVLELVENRNRGR